MAVYTTRGSDFTGAMDGVSLAGAWFDGSGLLSFGEDDPTWGGLMFITPYTLSAGDGFGNAGHSTIAPIGFSSGVLTLTLQTTINAAATRTFQAFVVPEPDADDYSTSALPGERNELAITDLESFSVEGASAGDAYTFSLNAVGLTRVNQVIRGSRYRGKLAISCQVLQVGLNALTSWASEENPSNTPPSLTTVEFADHTGFTEFELEKGRGRATHDDRLGLPIFSGDLVQDDYQKAVWVRSRDQDPEDPEERYKPKPQEGGRERDGRP